MIRILVVDDHPIVRQGLVAVLEDQTEFQVIAAEKSVEDGLAKAHSLHPDVVMLDLEMPEGNSIDAIPRFLAVKEGLQILIFTAYDTDVNVFGAIRAGASGYLLKGASAEEIARAIRVVSEGGSYLEPRIAAMLVQEVCGKRPTAPPLSKREQEVLRLVAEGRSNKQIAHALTISERTVKFHVTSLFQKLKAENRAQVVALAVQRHLL